MPPLTAAELYALFSPDAARFQMGLRRGDPANWHSVTVNRDAPLAERKHWLATQPERHVLWSETTAPLFAALQEWRSEPFDPTAAALAELGGRWAPDFLLLDRTVGGAFQLAGGCVCFPSAWAPEEKLGRPLAEIHSPVPGLNAELGRRIDTFLDRLTADSLYERENWGLAATPELNLHPALRRPRVGAEARVATTWLRIERQAFTRLPETGGVLFLIQVELHPLGEVAADPQLRAAFRTQLGALPAAVAEYKGLAAARPALLAELE